MDTPVCAKVNRLRSLSWKRSLTEETPLAVTSTELDLCLLKAEQQSLKKQKVYLLYATEQYLRSPARIILNRLQHWRVQNLKFSQQIKEHFHSRYFAWRDSVHANMKNTITQKLFTFNVKTARMKQKLNNQKSSGVLLQQKVILHMWCHADCLWGATGSVQRCHITYGDHLSRRRIRASTGRIAWLLPPPGLSVIPVRPTLPLHQTGPSEQPPGGCLQGDSGMTHLTFTVNLLVDPCLTCSGTEGSRL